MRRREFITLTGGTAAWSLAGRAQQAAKTYHIGYLSLGSPALEATRFDAFRAGLAALGYAEGKNLVIKTRWLNGGKYDQLVELAGQLADLKVDVIVTYATPGILAAKRATTTIPIVMVVVADALASGLVSSLAHPGSNVTGMTYFVPELAAKGLAKGGTSSPHSGGRPVQLGKSFEGASPHGHAAHRRGTQDRTHRISSASG